MIFFNMQGWRGPGGGKDRQSQPTENLKNEVLRPENFQAGMGRAIADIKSNQGKLYPSMHDVFKNSI